jgi:hypothetical protein
MTEIPPPPPPRLPTDPRPFGEAAPRAAGGCQKPILIGCGLITLLLGIGAIFFVLKAKDVLAFAMDKLRAQVMAQLPADLAEVDRERLQASFTETMNRIREGKIDPTALQELQKQLTEAAQATANRKLGAGEIRELQQALDRFNGAEPAPAPVPAPAAQPSPDPAPNG